MQETNYALAAYIIIIFLTTDHNFFASRKWGKVSYAKLDEITYRISSGSFLRRIAFLLLMPAALIFASSNAVYPNFQNKLLLLVIFLNLFWNNLTIFWSTDRSLSVRRLILWNINCLSALTIAAFTPLQNCIRLVLLCSVSFLIAGIFTEGVFKRRKSHRRKKGRRLHNYRRSYRFAGTLHPNQQAINCALLIFGSLFFLKIDVKFEIHGLIILLAVIILLLTRSRSAFWATATALVYSAVPLHYYFFSHRFAAFEASPPALWIGLSALFLLVVVLVFFYRFLLRVMFSILTLGRKSTATIQLTGRVPFWKSVMARAREKLIFGSGFGSFWKSKCVELMFKQNSWAFSDSHSMYLETLLNSGVIGLFLHLAVLLTTLRAATVDSGGEETFTLQFIIFIFIQGILESTFVLSNYFSFVLLLIAGSVAFNGL